MSKKSHICTASVVALGVAAVLVGPAAGQSVRTEKNISLALATEIAMAAVADCVAKNYTVTATVVDRAGQIKAVQRADNAGPSTLDSARYKAYTASTFRAPTSAIMDNAQKNPGAQHLWQIDGIILLAGGLPIKSGAETIGGVGVGGAPAGSLDEQCAQAGLDKAKDKLN